MSQNAQDPSDTTAEEYVPTYATPNRAGKVRFQSDATEGQTLTREQYRKLYGV